MDMTILRTMLLGIVILLAGCDNTSAPATPKAQVTVLDGKPWARSGV